MTKILFFEFTNSVNIKSIEYDPFMKSLSVVFKNGQKYDFVDVEQKVFYEMKEAPSAGRYFHTNIKNKYDFLRRTKSGKKQAAEENNEEGEE